jgi:hypothetical protein
LLIALMHIFGLIDGVIHAWIPPDRWSFIHESQLIVGVIHIWSPADSLKFQLIAVCIHTCIDPS